MLLLRTCEVISVYPSGHYLVPPLVWPTNPPPPRPPADEDRRIPQSLHSPSPITLPFIHYLGAQSRLVQHEPRVSSRKGEKKIRWTLLITRCVDPAVLYPTVVVIRTDKSGEKELFRT